MNSFEERKTRIGHFLKRYAIVSAILIIPLIAEYSFYLFEYSLESSALKPLVYQGNGIFPNNITASNQIILAGLTPEQNCYNKSAHDSVNHSSDIGLRSHLTTQEHATDAFLHTLKHNGVSRAFCITTRLTKLNATQNSSTYMQVSIAVDHKGLLPFAFFGPSEDQEYLIQ